MAVKSLAHPAHQTTPLEEITEQVEQAIERLRIARPSLSTRIDRAEHILTTHLSCTRQRMIRVRITADGHTRFLVKGSGGAVYTVDPVSWQCSCPDAHRRGKGCKHSIVCWLLHKTGA